ncbi:MFS transporter [Bacillus sp. 1P06AnD]|uniref:MFS transporter n=1 Tax=Bacillus sp. 1P06AnD TaxID=3132208 RepID=UPI0039A0CB22
MNKKIKSILTIVVLGMAGGSIYCLPYLKYVFYDQMINTMHISGSQLGLMITVYSLACTVIQIPGGIISDRISSKLSIFWSLLITSGLTILYAFIPGSYGLSLVIWFLMAFTTIFLCWPAIMKTIRFLGEDIGGGTAYGIYYAINGLTGGLVNMIALHVYGSFTSTDTGFFWAVIVIAAFTLIIPFVLMVLLRDYKEPTAEPGAEKPKAADVKAALKNSTVWIISITLFCVYTVYIAVTYFNPYLTSQFGISESFSGNLTIIRQFLFMALAPITGLIADKLFHSTLKWFLVGLTLVFVTIAGILFLGDSGSLGLVITLTLITAFFMCGLYSVMYSIMGECNIPAKVAGTAISIVSVVAFLPDSIMHTLFGKLIDSYGSTGYHYIFILMMGMCVLSFVGITVLLARVKKMKQAPAPVAPIAAEPAK